MKYPVISLLAFLSNCLFSYGNDLARGFNDDINWVTLEDGKKLAKEKNKPIMVLIHKTWCGACKALKPKFATDMEVQKLSEDFVMVNVQDDEEPKDREFAPDGGYIPRIVFMSPAGKVNEDIYNEKGSPQYKYYYSDPKLILNSMKKAQEVYKKDEL